jgi:hypothetical protein
MDGKPEQQEAHVRLNGCCVGLQSVDEMSMDVQGSTAHVVALSGVARPAKERRIEALTEPVRNYGMVRPSSGVI